MPLGEHQVVKSLSLETSMSPRTGLIPMDQPTLHQDAGTSSWPQAPSAPTAPRQTPTGTSTYYLNCTWYTTGPSSRLRDTGSQLRTCSALYRWIFGF